MLDAMFAMVIALAYVGWKSSWRSLFVAALPITLLPAAVLVWTNNVSLAELPAYAPHLAISCGLNLAIFLAIGGAIVFIRKGMIQRDQREAEMLARTLANIHRKSDAA